MADTDPDEEQTTESAITDEDESESETPTTETDATEEGESATDITGTEDDYGSETEDIESSETCETTDDTIESQRISATIPAAPSDEELRGEIATYLLPQDILSFGGRHIKAEEPEWGKSPVPLLSDIIVEAAHTIEDSELENFLKNARADQKQSIFRNLPLTLSLKTSLPLIEEGIYWERMCLRFWPACDVWRYSDNWKSMLVQRKVQELIASFVPGEQDIWELAETLQVFSEYVNMLQIDKLVKATEKEFSIDLSSEDFDEKLDDLIATPPSAHYIDFERIFECFPKLKKLVIMLSPKYLDFENFHFSIPDFNSLFRGLRKLKELKEFRISNGNVTNEQIEIILKTFLTHSFLTELDLSYNFIDNDVCNYVGKLLISKCPLESLILKNNKITDAGAKSIAAALFENTNLKKLDLSLNMIENEGACFLARILQTKSSLEDLDISKNKMTSVGGLAFGKLIKISNKLRKLKIQENALGESAGKLFASTVIHNSTLLELDVHFCGFTYEDEGIIHQSIMKNRSKFSFFSYMFNKNKLTSAEFVFY